MNGIVLAIVGNLILGISLIFDKIFLRDRVTGSTLTYIFWIGILNVFGLLVAPFGFLVPDTNTILLSFGAGIILFLASSAYYFALNAGEASQTLAIVGGFAPLATIGIAQFFSLSPLNIAEEIALGFLVIGGFAMFLSERVNFKKIFILVLFASLLLGLGSVLQKIIFTHTNFVSGFVLIKIGTIFATLMLLLVPRVRQTVFQDSRSTHPKHRFLFLGNRLLAGLAVLLLFYAVSLEHPALIEAISGSRYAIIFLIAIFLTKFKPVWLRETFTGWTSFGKILGTLLITIGLVGLGLQTYYEKQPVPEPKNVMWGVTFSELGSRQLGLDWKENYQAILGDLRPSAIRLVAYWDLIEPKANQWNFSDLDWQMDEAAKAGIPVVLTVGQKVPRWPECHYPEWLDRNDNELREKELLKYISTVIERYRSHSALRLWQIENEPFLLFGKCPPINPEFLDEEIALARTLDPQHQILLTDGGEFGNWYQASRRGDVFGTTLYRKVHNRFFGYVTYPLTPEFFPLKKSVVQFLTRKQDQKFVVIELGLEPWGEKQIYEMSVERQFELFNLSDFNDAIGYARQARFDTYYMWGAEWWYWLKTKHGDSRFWDEAKNIFHYK